MYYLLLANMIAYGFIVLYIIIKIILIGIEKIIRKVTK